MGRQKQEGGKKNGKNQATRPDTTANHDSMIWIDVERVRFQHSRIRPTFSSCGRTLTETLDAIRQGTLQPSDLPPIQVLIGPVDETDGKRWYFSLNNRRLWVLKRCREEGLLQNYNNQIQVRVRTPKSTAEMHRYTLANCVVEAKVVRESGGSSSSSKREGRNSGKTPSDRRSESEPSAEAFDTNDQFASQECIGESSDSDENDNAILPASSSNRFSALS